MHATSANASVPTVALRGDQDVARRGIALHVRGPNVLHGKIYICVTLGTTSRSRSSERDRPEPSRRGIELHRVRPRPLHLAIRAPVRISKGMKPMPVRELMSKDLVTLEEDQSFSEANQIVELERIRHIPVVKGRKLVGLVTHRDLLRAQTSLLLALGASIRVRSARSASRSASS